MENSLQLLDKSTSPNGAYFQLEQRVKDFSEALDRQESINDFEDVYTQLLLDIANQIYLREKEIFDNQSIFYKSSSDPTKFGTLIHLTDECLSQSQINFLRYLNSSWDVFLIFDLSCLPNSDSHVLRNDELKSFGSISELEESIFQVCQLECNST